MADIDVVEKPTDGAAPDRRLTWLMAALAILSVVGLMTWLAVQSDRVTTAALVQGDTLGAAVDGEEAADVEGAELGAVAGAPESYMGRRLRINDVEVAATLGPSAFWGDVPGANPFLVLLSPNVTVQPPLEGGRRYNVRGAVHAVTDSLLDDWVESGAIRPGARDEASFATHYLLAERMVP